MSIKLLFTENGNPGIGEINIAFILVTLNGTAKYQHLKRDRMLNEGAGSFSNLSPILGMISAIPDIFSPNKGSET